MSGPLQKLTALAASLTVAVAVCAEAVAPVSAQTAGPAVTSKEKAKAKVKASPTVTKAALDLNTATAEQLQETLPGVGEVTAKKIVAGRPYESVDDLTRAGVPARTIEQIRPLVTVTRPPQPRTKAAAKTKTATPEPLISKVDLNTATAAQLETLPGVGPAFAREIIAARPFRSLDDLDRVKGLGKARLDAIREHVTLTAAAPAVEPSPVGTPVAAPVRTKAMTKTAAAPAVEPSPVGTPVAPPVRTKAMTKAKTATSTATKPASRPASGQIINLNTASRDELDALPGIGPVKAEAILEYRKATPFRTKEDVMKVKGIKEGEFARIRDLITVD